MNVEQIKKLFIIKNFLSGAKSINLNFLFNKQSDYMEEQKEILKEVKIMKKLSIFVTDLEIIENIYKERKIGQIVTFLYMILLNFSVLYLSNYINDIKLAVFYIIMALPFIFSNYLHKTVNDKINYLLWNQ